MSVLTPGLSSWLLPPCSSGLGSGATSQLYISLLFMALEVLFEAWDCPCVSAGSLGTTNCVVDAMLLSAVLSRPSHVFIGLEFC